MNVTGNEYLERISVLVQVAFVRQNPSLTKPHHRSMLPIIELWSPSETPQEVSRSRFHYAVLP